MKELKSFNLEKLEFDLEEAKELFSNETLNAMQMAEINGGAEVQMYLGPYVLKMIECVKNGGVRLPGYEQDYAQQEWGNFCSAVASKGVPTPSYDISTSICTSSLRHGYIYCGQNHVFYFDRRVLIGPDIY